MIALPPQVAASEMRHSESITISKSEKIKAICS